MKCMRREGREERSRERRRGKEREERVEKISKKKIIATKATELATSGAKIRGCQKTLLNNQ